MNKLIFTLFLTAYAFCSFSMNMEQKDLVSLINLSYKDFAENPHNYNFLQESLQALNTYKSPTEEEIILIQQAYLKLSYLIGSQHSFQKVVKSDLFKKSDIFSPPPVLFDVIYNNDGYSKIKHKEFIKGKAIKDNLNPIGYVIFMPKIEIKNIVVNIYGGRQKIDINTSLIKPVNHLTNDEKLLLNNGTVLIKLNLPDLLKNETHQKHLEESLFIVIHNAIDYFCATLKQNPAIIHKKLETLKDKPIFLMGLSFGGMMSVYHAINYPGTFAGYISHAGSLYGQNGYDDKFLKSYLKIADKNKIKKIQEPVFIHHSLDDNRVNVKASLEFYRLAKLAKKEHLIKLFIDDHGSSVDEKKEADLHGHFFPENYYLQLFSEQFIDFINSNGKNIDPDLNEWRYEKYTKIAYRFEGLGSYIHKNQERNIYKVLLSKGITHYYDLRKSGNKDDFEKLWATQIAPYLWEIKVNESVTVNEYNETLAPLVVLLRRQELKKLLEYSDTELKNMVKIILENYQNSVVTDDFASNIFKDIKYWLSNEEVYENSILNNANRNFLSVLTDKNFFDFCINKNISSAVEIFNHKKLKEELLNTIKEQHQRALRIISKKLTKEPEKVKELIESYR